MTKNNYIDYKNASITIFASVIICCISILWSVGSMPDYLRALPIGMLLFVFGILICLIHTKIKESEGSQKYYNIEVKLGFQIIIIIISFYTCFSINVSENHWVYFLKLLGFSIIWIIVYTVILYSIYKWSDILELPTIDSIKELEKIDLKNIIKLKLKISKRKDVFDNIKSAFITLYSMIITALIGFGIDIFEVPFNTQHVQVDLINSTVTSVFQVALILFGLAIVLQLIISNLEYIAEMRLLFINELIKYKEKKNSTTWIESIIK